MDKRAQSAIYFHKEYVQACERCIWDSLRVPSLVLFTNWMFLLMLRLIVMLQQLRRVKLSRKYLKELKEACFDIGVCEEDGPLEWEKSTNMHSKGMVKGMNFNYDSLSLLNHELGKHASVRFYLASHRVRDIKLSAFRHMWAYACDLYWCCWILCHFYIWFQQEDISCISKEKSEILTTVESAF